MKGKCHLLIGDYMVRNYLECASDRSKWAFMLGCIEPDRNPATYFKGSIRCQWMRGHNWGNTQPYIYRLVRRLEKKNQFGLLDYYNMGKLIHYVTDAFTFAHNPEFGDDLKLHCQYEQELQDYFPSFIKSFQHGGFRLMGSAADVICEYHKKYLQNPMGIENDSRFAVTACSAVMAMVTAFRIAPAVYPAAVPALG